MRNVCEWFERGYDKMTPEDEPKRRWLFIWDRDVLDQSDGPLAALRRFLAQPRGQGEVRRRCWPTQFLVSEHGT